MEERNVLATIAVGLFQVIKCVVLTLGWIIIIACVLTKNDR